MSQSVSESVSESVTVLDLERLAPLKTSTVGWVGGSLAGELEIKAISVPIWD